MLRYCNKQLLRKPTTFIKPVVFNFSSPYSTSIPDASESSHTGEFVNSISKPYSVTTYARPNLVLTHGKGSYIYDLENRKYVDFTSGIAVTCLGHANDEITNLIADQASKLLHCSNLYYNLPAGELANKLVTKTKEFDGMKDASRVFLCNSGTEANEAALKFARKYGKSKNPDKYEFITFENSFHGRTMGALSVTPNPKYQEPFSPLIPGVHVAKPNDIDSVKALINKDKTCAVIIEPIQGEGGVNPVDTEFLVELRKLCDDNDVLLIYDEIQCGLGRSGKLWAHSWLGPDAHPDIVTIAKALGNGFPIGATMITEKVEGALSVGDHGTTYGGNPLASTIGSFIVEKIADEAFLSQVQDKSAKFIEGLNEIAEENPEDILKVKGKGLLLGLQFRPDFDINKVVEKCREYGLLVITAGMNTIRLVPALNIPDEAITEGLSILRKSIKESK
ncbi:ARG8 Acetylornithine aminotransferase [Candida maltosa Xu316]|uniref:Acetylornithine aminotransferase, mitochondrial n=1 Tax=Candida maltosa (strain Xu316) TaxID=1245528 RepID=M3JTZ5_CANMX|nr:Acetylornithine aminotransferase, mitochondrial [Candida maltosa Xu316]